MKKVVLTGGTGMIGMAVTDLLLKKGCEVLLLHRPNSSKLLQFQPNPKLKFAPCDLIDLESFEYNEHDFDTFVHLGWKATIGANRDNADLQEENIRITLNAVKLAKKLGCNTFIGTGSQAEYGVKVEKLTPKLACDPQSGYGIAKFAAGKLSRLLANQLNMRHCWVRILSVYGPNDNPNTLISYVIKTLLKKETPILTKCEQDWDYIYVEDCAEAIYSVAVHGHDGMVYPIGSGQTRKLKEYIEIIKDKIDSGSKVEFGGKEYLNHQPMYLCADISSLIEDTGFVPKYTFEEGINKTINYIKKEGLL